MPTEIPTNDEAALLARFEPIFQRIAKGALEREHRRELAFEPVRWLREAGFGALRIPRAEGGAGVTVPQLFRLLVRLAEADSNLPHILRAHFAFVEGRLNAPDAAERAEWFPRIVAGDVFGAAMAERTDTSTNSVRLTRLDSEDGDTGDAQWVIDGVKYYSTGTLYADWIAAAALDGDERVQVVVRADAPGVTRVDDWDGFGQRLSASGTTRFERVPVLARHITRRFSAEEYRADSYLGAWYQQNHLATLAGIVRAVLRDAVAFVQPRTRAFGVPGQSSPRQDPLVQQVVGRLGSLAFAAEGIVDRVSQAIEAAWQARLAGAPDTAIQPLVVAADVAAYQGQLVLIDLVAQATQLLFEVGGASATAEARRLDRHWRNARTLASHNPAIFRARALGDWHLNGVAPGGVWAAQLKKAKAEAAGEAPAEGPGTARAEAAEATDHATVTA